MSSVVPGTTSSTETEWQDRGGSAGLEEELTVTKALSFSTSSELCPQTLPSSLHATRSMSLDSLVQDNCVNPVAPPTGVAAMAV